MPYLGNTDLDALIVKRDNNKKDINMQYLQGKQQKHLKNL
jgi:hypothetical protein